MRASAYFFCSATIISAPKFQHHIDTIKTRIHIFIQQQTSLIQSNTQTNLDLRNTPLRYGFHIQHKHFGTFPVEDLGTCRIRIFEGISKYQQLKKKSDATAPQYSARLSAHPNDLIANLMELPDNRRLWRHLPNDLATRFVM
jgi:hypothetical protein